MLTTLEITYTLEDFDPERPDWPRWLKLFKAHADEVNRFPQVLKLDLDIDMYLERQNQGRLVIATARDGEGVLQGYSSYFTGRHPHYRKIWIAIDDAHYVTPELRTRGIGTKVRALALEELKRRGVKIATARDKDDHRHEHHLPEMGFTPWERCWVKIL